MHYIIQTPLPENCVTITPVPVDCTPCSQTEKHLHNNSVCNCGSCSSNADSSANVDKSSSYVISDYRHVRIIFIKS